VKDATRFFRAVDRYRDIPPAEFEGELEAAGVSATGASDVGRLFQSVGAGVPPAGLDPFLEQLVARGLDEPARAGAARLRSLFALLEPAGLADRVVFDPTVVRGLAYYTSTVFEAYARSDGGRAIFGGGRYDHLIELFEGPPTPASGLAIGEERLEILLKAAGRWPDGEPPLHTYVVVVRPELTPSAIGLVQELRRAGLSADCDLLARSMSRQLKEAARRRAGRALILGLKEAAPDAVVERDLESGAQREIPRHAVARSA
jgi:histidyl-tRNA synthetase